jgi:hypothetical protein
MRGPTTPVCRKGTPCSEPASGAKLLFEQDRVVVATAVVAKNGSYSVVLPFGAYTVAVAPPPSIGRGIEPRMVRVSAGPARRIDFRIDTGIR